MKTPIEILDEMIDEYNNMPEYQDITASNKAFALQEAKERIQNLDDISKETGWIKVSERLPERFTDILLFPGIEVGYLSVTRFFIYNNGDYSEGGYGSDYEAELVTHWMPLPLPPNN